MAHRPRKVAQIITKLDVGGAQETAVALADRLRGLGFETVLVAGGDAGTGGDMWEEARRRGVRTRRSRHLVRRLDPVRDLLALAELYRLFRRERPDIVHTHSSKAGVLGRMAAWMAGVPVIVHTVHGWSFRDFQSPLRRWLFVGLERCLARVTGAIVVVTRRDAEAGRLHGIGNDEQYRVIRSGIEINRFRAAARRRRAPNPGELRIGTVTRFGEPKDPVTTIRAFARLLGTRPLARLLIVGDGPDRARVEAEVNALGIGRSVELLGVRNDIDEVLGGLDIFVFTSHSEGLPRCVVEALAAGLPVVATDVGGVAEVVTPDVGTLVGDGDVEATSRALRYWVEQQPAGSPPIDEFSVEAMTSASGDLYTELLADGDRITYACLQPMRHGDAAHAHVNEIIAGLERRGWTVELFAAGSFRGRLGVVKRVSTWASLSAQAAWRLRKTDVLYARLHPALVVLTLLARRLGIPVIQEVNGSLDEITVVRPWLRPFTKAVRWCYETQIRSATGVVTVTPELSEWARSAGAAAVVTIGNGAAIDRFRPGVGRPPGAPVRYVLFFGALARWQGIGRVLDAARDPAWPRSVVLVIAGDGAMRGEVELAAATLPTVEYLGPIAHEDVPAWVANASAVTILKEGVIASSGFSPLKLFESMACGTPVVVSDVPGLRDVVHAESCGVIVDAASPSGLATRIAELVEDREGRKLMGIRGRAAAVERYSWDARAHETHEFILSLSNRPLAAT